ncbi:Protein SAN1 [Spathaspora sp. JA1]|nr:Protein SAN1 [Spathaspora sp. JA1]
MDNNRDIEEDSNRETSPGNNNGNRNRRHRIDMGIFERFMDTILGTRRDNSSYITWQQTNPPTVSPPSRISNDISEELTNDNITREQQQAQQTRDRQETSNNTEERSDSSSEASPTNNTTNDNPPDNPDDPNRAIVITVNYVFSDENQPNNPNRAGSLVMSLPNNASNRDPRVIQEFIRLATQLAYTSILNGLHNEKGITLNKFSSFPGIKLHELDESNICSICFEVYESIQQKVDMDESVSHKKRRLHDSSTFTTSSSTNSRHDHDRNNDRPILLADLTEKFDHIPIKMPCGHIFGKDCLCEWLKEHTTCPLCRFSVAEPQQTVRPIPPQTQGARNFTIFTIPTENSMVTSPTNVTVQNNISDSPPPAVITDLPQSAPPHPVRTSAPPTSPPPAPPAPPAPPIRRLLRSSGGGWREASEPLSTNDPLSHVIEYLTRQRTIRTPPINEPLFPSGMTSRRNADGTIETSSTPDVDGEELRNLFNDTPIPSDRNESSSESTRNEEESQRDDN